MSAALSGPQKSVENRFFTKKNEAKDDQTVFYMTEMREWSGFHTRCNKSWWIGWYSSRTHWTGALNTFVGLICLLNMGVLCMCKGQMCLRESWLHSAWGAGPGAACAGKLTFKRSEADSDPPRTNTQKLSLQIHDINSWPVMSKVHHRVTGQKIIQNTYMIWSVLTSDFNVPSGIYNPGVRCLSPGLRGTGRICLKSEHMFCVYDVFSCRNVLSHQAASPTTGPWQTPFSSHSFSCWQHTTLALWRSPRTCCCVRRVFCFLSSMMISD